MTTPREIQRKIPEKEDLWSQKILVLNSISSLILLMKLISGAAFSNKTWNEWKKSYSGCVMLCVIHINNKLPFSFPSNSNILPYISEGVFGQFNELNSLQNIDCWVCFFYVQFYVNRKKLFSMFPFSDCLIPLVSSIWLNISFKNYQIFLTCHNV